MFITFLSCSYHPYGLSTTPQRACSSQLGRPSQVRSHFPKKYSDSEPTISSDDEYRLLRQDVFEQYSGNANIPVESPLVPITAIHVQRGCKPLVFIVQAST